MTTALASHSLTQRLATRLRQRQEELRQLLQAGAAGELQRGDVQDFKDLAVETIRALVDEATLAHAETELAQVVAALRRLDDGSYGFCLDCGEPIAEARLMALPATPHCVSCQAVHERRG
jgi:DnaK suppressor protein